MMALALNYPQRLIAIEERNQNQTKSKYPKLCVIVESILLAFPTSYIVELGFKPSANLCQCFEA